ncbi:MAG TPA: class I SAM-dependent methyltransferase [Gaiellaceae bacterium]|nr:class I SAM-dependent methyltransferase [Gaiellaceae bacterium]
MRSFEDFLRAYLPEPPARILDVGCGFGELTTALAVAGYDALGIDPLAPHGDRFRRLKLEDLEEEPLWDAVVSARSLHPMRDLDAALDKVVRLLRTGGILAVEEFAWDLVDEATLAWLWEQRRAIAAAGGPPAPESLEELRTEWEEDRVGMNGFEALVSGLRGRFGELAFEPVPFLHRLLGGGTSAVLEQALIDAGEIRAVGFRFAGRRR